MGAEKPENKLETEVFGLRFPSPVGVAAGLDKNAEMVHLLPEFGFGFAEIGTVTPKPQQGNPKPRLFRLPKDKALINRMGFNNEGASAIAAKLHKDFSNFIIGGNIGKNSATPNKQAVDDYIKSFKELYMVADYFVVNVSCPNITDLRELQDKEHLKNILTAIVETRKSFDAYKPVLLKLSPDLNQEQIDDSVMLTEETGLDGFVISNTTIQRKGLQTSPKRISNIGQGGLSGRPVRNRSTQMINYVFRKTSGKLPIIGVGGIFSASDALEKLDAGASLIQVYTGFIYEGPGLIKSINRAIAKRRS